MMCFILLGLMILINVPSKIPIYLDNFHKCVDKVIFFSYVDHQISSISAWLMHDTMKDASSHNENFDWFHMKVSYLP
jgi:hypothetical protein